MSNNQLPQLDQLKPGDVVSIRSEIEDWIVKSTFNCIEPNDGNEPYRWVEYELEARGSNDQAFLSVELDDGEWSIEFFDRQIQPDDIGYERGQEFPESIQFEGLSFALLESGKMRVSKLESTISWRGEYADYVRKDGQIISIEAYPDPTHTPRETELEIWMGREIAHRSIELYPAMTSESRQGLLTLQTAPPATVSPLRQQAQPLERRYNTMSDGAQLALKAGGASIAVIVIILLIVLL